MALFDKIDLHMHTTVSDGTDSPKEIVSRVKNAGITLFSVTDHDSLDACSVVKSALKKGDPAFICGVEFSCKDEKGRYHVLGYGYDENAQSIREVVKKGHGFRLIKLEKRLDFLKKEFGFAFTDADIEYLHSLNNPGKPHVANLMVGRGYAPTKEYAIENYINKLESKSEYVRPEEAINGVLNAGGIPVLAHPSYGRGDELYMGEEMENRLKRLIGFGLRGVEGFYSGFTSHIQKEILSLAEKYGLFVTAGSDYHGSVKLVRLGDTNLKTVDAFPKGLERFLKEVKIHIPEN